MKQIVFVLSEYYDYNRTAIQGVVSSREVAESWVSKDSENRQYDEYVVDDSFVS